MIAIAGSDGCPELSSGTFISGTFIDIQLTMGKNEKVCQPDRIQNRYVISRKPAGFPYPW